MSLSAGLIGQTRLSFFRPVEFLHSRFITIATIKRFNEVIEMNQSLRRFKQTIALFVAALLLSTSVLAQQAALKRALTHADYDGWRAIQGQQLSRDGKFIAYALVPQDGDGEIVARNLETGKEWRHTR